MKLVIFSLMIVFALQTAEATPFWKRKNHEPKCRDIGMKKLKAYKPMSKSQLRREQRQLEKYMKQVKPSFVTHR